MKQNRSRFLDSLAAKMMIGIIIVAAITYSVSGFFIFYLYSYFSSYIVINYSLYIIITLFLGVIWCGILGFFGAKYISIPIVNLEKSVSKSATGDLSHPAEINNSKDEISILASSYNLMIDNLKNLVLDIKNNGKITNQHINEVLDFTNQSKGMSDLIYNLAGDSCTGTEKTFISIENARTTIENVQQIASTLNDETSKTKVMAGNMVNTLNKSNNTINNLLVGLDKISTESELVSNSVSRLEELSRKINSVVLAVGEISAQTNMLSLNASIESAKAKTNGKGFEVVADEIRRLAEQSAESVNLVTTYISSIKEEVKNVADLTKKQLEITKEENVLGKETEKNIADVTLTIHTVDEAINKMEQLTQKQAELISIAAKEMAEVYKVAEKVSTSTGTMSEHTRVQAEILEKILKEMNSLKEESKDLIKSVNQFRS